MIDYDATISKSVRRENELERANHESSGKLSASILNQPLLEQVLKIIGVPPEPVDDYTLRLFARGRQAEDFIVKHLPKGKEQNKIEYRDTVGLVDYIGEDGIPVEVKSTKNSAFKWIAKEKKPKVGHAMQACLYAMALKQPQYRVLYVAADDLRVLTFEHDTDALKGVVDGIIDEVYGQIKSGVLPEFVAREKWQESGKYSSYSNWIILSQKEAMAKLEREYSDAFKKLKGE
jgi:hypothetical protein